MRLNGRSCCRYNVYIYSARGILFSGKFIETFEFLLNKLLWTKIMSRIFPTPITGSFVTNVRANFILGSYPGAHSHLSVYLRSRMRTIFGLHILDIWPRIVSRTALFSSRAELRVYTCDAHVFGFPVKIFVIPIQL